VLRRVKQQVRKVFGVGINDMPGTCLFEYGKKPKLIQAWQGMLERCYCSKRGTRTPTYAGCTVDPRWHRLSGFKTWFDLNYREGYHLDKDVLEFGNKIYGPDTCAFVPHYVNTMLNLCNSRRGSLPLGVSLRKLSGGRCAYISQCSDNKGAHLASWHMTLRGAMEQYNTTKGRVIRDVAAEALLAQAIDDRIYCGLIRHAELFESGQRQIEESPYWALIA
jgi:hypothetical protein